MERINVLKLLNLEELSSHPLPVGTSLLKNHCENNSIYLIFVLSTSGREALQEQLDNGIRKLFVMLLLDPLDHHSDLDPWPWGGEPIYR